MYDTNRQKCIQPTSQETNIVKTKRQDTLQNITGTGPWTIFREIKNI